MNAKYVTLTKNISSNSFADLVNKLEDANGHAFKVVESIVRGKDGSVQIKMSSFMSKSDIVNRRELDIKGIIAYLKAMSKYPYRLKSSITTTGRSLSDFVSSELLITGELSHTENICNVMYTVMVILSYYKEMCMGNNRKYMVPGINSILSNAAESIRMARFSSFEAMESISYGGISVFDMVHMITKCCKFDLYDDINMWQNIRDLNAFTKDIANLDNFVLATTREYATYREDDPAKADTIFAEALGKLVTEQIEKVSPKHPIEGWKTTIVVYLTTMALKYKAEIDSKYESVPSDL